MYSDTYIPEYKFALDRIKLFVVCSVLGLCVLLPLNYCSNKRSSDDPQSMDHFTISNISGGSDR